MQEGTSEIQRLIIARALERRGVDQSSGEDRSGAMTKVTAPAGAFDLRPLFAPRSIAVVGASPRG